MNQQRRYTDRHPGVPRSTYIPTAASVIGNTDLCRVGSEAHASMLGLGFTELLRHEGCALMSPPQTWIVA